LYGNSVVIVGGFGRDGRKNKKLAFQSHIKHIPQHWSNRPTDKPAEISTGFFLAERIMLKNVHGFLFTLLFILFSTLALFGATSAIADEPVIQTADGCAELDCTLVLVTYTDQMTKFSCQSAKGKLNRRLVGALDAYVMQYTYHPNGDLKEIHFLLYDKKMNKANFSILTTGLGDILAPVPDDSSG
jgi:hypothetical protein